MAKARDECGSGITADGHRRWFTLESKRPVEATVWSSQRRQGVGVFSKNNLPFSNLIIPLGHSLAPMTPNPEFARPDWVLANPKSIDRMLARASAKPSGGWRVVCATSEVGDAGSPPKSFRVDGVDIVVWRADGKLMAAPDSCPHMGARLSSGRVRCGHLVCPWHGLELGQKGHGVWHPLPAFDDGVLFWLRVHDGADATPRPVISERPKDYIDAVVRMEARCEPRDIIANRLDPWHGAHFHGHSFARLSTLSVTSDVITVRVAYRIAGPLVVEVDAQFACPDSNTIVMTIIGGEGVGSVVETHATAIDVGKTMVIEATLATSERSGFMIARRLAPILRPWMRWGAERLWQDDCEYAERTYALRMARKPPKSAARPSRVPG